MDKSQRLEVASMMVEFKRKGHDFLTYFSDTAGLGITTPADLPDENRLYATIFMLTEDQFAIVLKEFNEYADEHFDDLG